MRIASSQIYSIANVGMRDAQVAIDQTNKQITSGKRVLTPADDPVAATNILALHQEIARTTQYNSNINIASNNLSLEDTTLQSVTNVIQRLKELAVSAGNTAVLTQSDYQSIAAEVNGALDQLVNLQNTHNAAGQYIFSGFQSATTPFVKDANGAYQYQGDEGQLRLQAAASVTVAVNDSGKRLFMDIPSSNNTFTTSTSPSNKASPPATISVGQVVDQAAYDKLFPKDLMVTFNANAAVNPPSPNYTVTEKSSGKVLVDKQVYVSGQDIQVSGVKFSISGSPYPGVAATPATIPLTPASFVPTDFSVTNGSIDVTVGGITETLKLDRNITSNSGPDNYDTPPGTADLITALGGGDPSFYAIPANANTTAAENFKKLQNLGIQFTANGFTAPNGQNITVSNGSAATDSMLGIVTQTPGTTSADGVLATPGDTFLVSATNKQGLLTTVSRFSDALQNMDNTSDGKAQLSKVIAATLANLDNALTNVSTVQGEVGARQNMLDSSKSSNSDIQLSSKEVLSQVEDLDYAEASTRLQMQSFVLSAAQQSFIRVSDLNLFKYM